MKRLEWANTFFSCAAACLVAAFLVPAGVCRAETWTNLVAGDASGSWNTTGNWNPNTVPNGVGASALFNTLNLGANSTVSLATPVTAGALSFGDTTPSHDWLVSGSAITNAVSSGYPTVTVDNRQVTFNNSLFGALDASAKGLSLAVEEGRVTGVSGEAHALRSCWR